MFAAPLFYTDVVWLRLWSRWLTWLQNWLTINRVYGGFVRDMEALSYFFKMGNAIALIRKQFQAFGPDAFFYYQLHVCWS